MASNSYHKAEASLSLLFLFLALSIRGSGWMVKEDIE